MAQSAADGTSIPRPLSQEELQNICNIYHNIPYFMLSRLRPKIDDLPWVKTSAACDALQPLHEEEATRLYRTILEEIDAFIIRESPVPGVWTDNSRLMILDKFEMKKKYQENPVGFVQAMASCLQKEKILQFLKEPGQTSPGVSPSQRNCQDEAMLSEETLTKDVIDSDLEQIEGLVQNTRELIWHFNQLDNNWTELNSADLLPAGADALEASIPSQWEMTALQAHCAQIQETTQNRSDAFQNVLSHLQTVSSMCKDFIDNLVQEIDRWKREEVLHSARLRPEDSFGSHAYQRFPRFAEALCTLTAWLSPPPSADLSASHSSRTHHPETGLLSQLRQAEQSNAQAGNIMLSEIGAVELVLKEVEKRYIESIIIVSLQPPELVGIQNKNQEGSQEKPKANKTEQRSCSTETLQSDAQDTDGQEKKDKSFTSKKKQMFDTKISIPGGEKFPGLCFINPQVEYVREVDLAAEARKQKLATPGKQRASSPQGNMHWTDVSPLQDTLHCGLLFKEMSVTDLKRERQDKQHKDFARLRYRATVAVNNSQYTVEVLSLPFLLATGSIQLLAFIGARMWYLASSPDMYHGDFTCQDSLPTETVIDMLDLRVRHIDRRGRHLSTKEKDCLRSRLPSNNGQVQLNDFVLTKTIKKEGKKKEYSFFTWFYSVVNTIETIWLEAWLDGAIYGLISDKQGQELLAGDTVPVGAFLLRPSFFYLDKTSSTNALAALSMQVKCATEDPNTKVRQKKIQTVPLLAEFLQTNGLYEAVIGINPKEVGLQFAATYLQGFRMRKKVDFLKKYEKKTDDFEDLEYNFLVRRLERWNLTVKGRSVTCSSGQRPAVTYSKKKAGPSEAKRPRKRGRAGAPSSPVTVEKSESTSPQTPSYEVLASMETDPRAAATDLKPDLNVLSFPSQASPGNQSQRSGAHAEAKSGESVAVCTPGARKSPSPQFETFGNVTIDTSRIGQRLGLTGVWLSDNVAPPNRDEGNMSLNALPHRELKNEPNAMSPNNGSNVISPNNVSNVMPPSNMHNAMPSNNMSNAMPSNNVSNVMPPNNVSNVMLPNNMSNAMSPNNVSNVMSPNNMSNAMSANNVSNAMSANDASSAMSPSSVSHSMSPLGIPHTMSPNGGVSSALTPKSLPNSLSPCSVPDIGSEELVDGEDLWNSSQFPSPPSSSQDSEVFVPPHCLGDYGRSQALNLPTTLDEAADADPPRPHTRRSARGRQLPPSKIGQPKQRSGAPPKSGQRSRKVTQQMTPHPNVDCFQQAPSEQRTSGSGVQDMGLFQPQQMRGVWPAQDPTPAGMLQVQGEQMPLGPESALSDLSQFSEVQLTSLLLDSALGEKLQALGEGQGLELDIQDPGVSPPDSGFGDGN